MLELLAVIAVIYLLKRWLVRRFYSFATAIAEEIEKAKQEREDGR